MLFDLRSRGRKRAVKGIYAGLAVLMGAGLVLFGVGGSVSGGLLDAFKSNTQSTSDLFSGKVKTAQQKVTANPQNAAAWATLAKVKYQQAAAGSGFDQTNGVFTDSGKKQLSSVKSDWNKYLSLKPAKPDASVAQLMVQAFGPSGLADYDSTVSAMEVVLASRPASVGLYVQYAEYAYLAGQTRKGDLASTKAEELAPKAQKATVKSELASVKQQASQQAASDAAAAAGVTTSGATLPTG